MTLVASIGLLLIAGALSPSVMAQPYPDLALDEMDVHFSSPSLIEGVEVTITGNVTNMGQQNAFSLMVTLYDHGMDVGDDHIGDIIIGDSAGFAINWTPEVPGNYLLTLRAWYGPESEKHDMNWSNNNVSVPVEVKSRPNVAVTDQDLSYNAPDPNYVVDGDTVIVRATLHNLGGADVSSCRVGLWEISTGTPELIYNKTQVTIPGMDQVQETFLWNTTGMSGLRILRVVVSEVMPNETALSDNVAHLPVKVHTIQDRLFVATMKREINSDYKIQFFHTVKDNATLTITRNGNVTMFQDFDDQYDIELMDGAYLIMEGCRLLSEKNFSVSMEDDAHLVLRDVPLAQFRIDATGDCTVLLENSTLHAPSVSMRGGTLGIHDGSVVEADWMLLDNVETSVTGSTLMLGDTLVVNGNRAAFQDTELRVVREYETFADALAIYPQIEFFNPDTFEVEDMPPGLVADGGAVVGLTNVSVESLIYVSGEDNYLWTNNRLGANDRSSVINIHRYVYIEVRDWSGQAVPGATVDVLDYFDDDVLVSETTDEEGNALLTVKTDYVTATQKPYVGNMRVRASAFGRTSETMSFSHSKYPDMEFKDNLLVLRIDMPPNPHPDRGSRYWESPKDETITGGTSAIDRNIIIDGITLTLMNTIFTLEQEWDFQWFILIRGSEGTLRMVNASLVSQYDFNIYIEDTGRLVVTQGSLIPDAYIIASDNAKIKVEKNSEIEGGIYAECQEIVFVNSQLELTDTLLDASKVSVNGGTIHENERMVVRGGDVELLGGVEVSPVYQINKDVGFDTLRLLTSYTGWTLLNDLETLTNISAGYFTYFPEECTITIEARRLKMSNALVYSIDTSILVRRSSLPDQTIIEDSWVGGLNLTLVADDMYARDSSFNRPLDDFSESDHVQLYSCEVPAIVCHENATAERYWRVSLVAIDAAGSLRPQALLQVVSTETNQTIHPDPNIPGSDQLPSSRTDTKGWIAIDVLANTTDSTGDYFVGSIRMRFKYDRVQYEDEPTYTDWWEVNLKADLTMLTMRFPDVIRPPDKDIDYVLYNVTYTGPTQDLKVFNHTWGGTANNTLAIDFLRETTGINASRVREWQMITNETIQMVFRASALINNEWRDLDSGVVQVLILTHPDYDDNSPYMMQDGTVLKWSNVTDGNGVGMLNIQVPDKTGEYQLYVRISGGKYDPTYQVVSEKNWNFSVIQPLNIQIVSAYISPDRPEVGSSISVSGTVKGVYTNIGIEGAEVTITGDHLSPYVVRTNPEGRFTVNVQAPLKPADNLTMVITAIDPASEEEDVYILTYIVVDEPKRQDEDGAPWKLIMVVLVVLGIVFAVAVGAVLVYRRHYGDLVECGECGAFIPANSISCPKCGVDFETDLARCSECEAWIPANSTSCPVCGTPFTIESLEEQVLREEMEEEVAPIDQLTTSTAQIPPLHLDGAAESARFGEREEKRRRRIKKRVKKRLTVAEGSGASDAEGEPEEAKDLFVGEATEDATRLPGLGVDESMLSDDELSRLLPTEDMLKELMLTSEQVPSEEGPEDLEESLLEEETGEVEEAPEEEAPSEELEEIPPPEEAPEAPEEEVPEAPEEEEAPEAPEEEEAPEAPEEELAVPEEGLAGSAELLSELGLADEVPTIDEGIGEEEPSEEDESTLSSLLTEEESKEAPKLCPNCGGNWILYKDGEYTCRICGETW